MGAVDKLSREGRYYTGYVGRLMMVLLYVAGVIDLLWVAVITACALVEKAASHG